MSLVQEEIFHPPPGPPPQLQEKQKPDSREIEIFHAPPGPPALHHFKKQGWLRLPLSGNPEWSVIDDLIKASKSFFDTQDTYKNTKVSKNTEEGFYRVPGEKEYITIRDFSEESCPVELRSAGRKAWEDVFYLFKEVLQEIEERLRFRPGTLARFAEASDVSNGNEKLGASMLRCFRYDWKHDNATVVSEGHNDLGILSLVVSDAAGLQVLNKTDKLWYNAEIITDFDQGFPKASSHTAGVLLSGREMQHFTNCKYAPGTHAVVSPGKVAPERNVVEGKEYRYSLVFILRADESQGIDYEALDSDITGAVPVEERCENVKELFRRIRVGHWNVNMTQREREAQKQKLAAEKAVAKPHEGPG